MEHSSTQLQGPKRLSLHGRHPPMPSAMRACRRATALLPAMLGTALVASSLWPPASALGATQQTTVQTALASTYTVSTAKPTKSYASSAYIRVSKSKYRGFIEFSTAGVDLSTLTKAELLLTPKAASGSKKVSVRPANATSVSGLTRRTAPTVGSKIGTSAKLKAGKRIAITLTDLSKVKAKTVLALNLTGSGKATFYKSGKKAPALRLTTSAAATSVSTVPSNPTAPSEPTTPSEPTAPSNSSVGVPAGTKLTKVYGDVKITTAGTVLQNVDVEGYVKVAADNVTIKNSIIRGGETATASRALIMDWSDAKNLVVKDTTLVPRNPSVWLDGISGKDFTAERVDISGVVDAVKVIGSGVTVKDCLLHDAYYRSSGVSYQSDGSTHNDGVQVEGGGNLVISGTRISGFHNAAIMVTQNAAKITGLTISGNTLADGGCTVNLAEKGKGPLSGVKIVSNRFGRNNASSYACPMAIPSTTTVEMSGNSWLDSTAAVVPYRN